MTRVQRKLVVGTALAAALAVAILAPSLGAATPTETTVSAAAGGAFDRHAHFGALKLEHWSLGMGVVVYADGTADGDFQITIDGRRSGRHRTISLEGRAEAGSVGESGATFSSGVTFSGTALLGQGDGTLATSHSFRVRVTGSTYQLTIDGTALPAVDLGAGAIFVG